MDHAQHGQHVHGGVEMQALPERHAGHDINVLWRKFWVVLILTIPVVIYSPSVREFLNLRAPFRGSEYVPFVLGTFIFFYGGIFFLRGAVGELRTRTPGMMTLVSLAITVAYAFSVAVTLGYPGTALYPELCTLVTVMLFGHWMEMRAVTSARGALGELAKLLPDKAERIADDRVESVPVDQLHPGDALLVRPGGRIPADGKVLEGSSEVNESMITGESRPVPKSPGGQVIAGTVNGNRPLRVEVTKVGSDTMLAGIMRLVAEAQASKSRAQNLADRAAYWLTLIAVSVGVLTFAAWLNLGWPLQFAISRSVTVLVIACPHALGLAIPLVIAISTTLAARNGFLVRDRMALETAKDLHTVAFDKTGTLTTGRQGVQDIFPMPGVDPNKALAVAAAVERYSEHSLGKAIFTTAEERGLAIPEAADFEELPGRGAQAKLADRMVQVGGPKLLEAMELTVPEQIRHSTESAQAGGQTLVYLVDEGEVRAAIALADVVRTESLEAVRELKDMGIQVVMMTGDSEDVAKWVAFQLGIREYYANVLPEDKARLIQEMRQRGRRVAMVGDGVNDAPALVSADIGIAIGAGTDVAIEAGGIILVRNDPRDVIRIIRLSRASYGKMVQNLFWATGYNVVAIPLAAGILANYGILLPPAAAALFMSVSTVIVAANAQLLRRVQL